MEERGTAVIAATRVVAALSLLLVPDRADAAELDLELADPDLELVAIDSDPKESFLAIHLDTAGRIFVGGREAIFLYEPGDGGGYRPRRELVRFPPHSWVYDLTVRGRDLYALTISALYIIRDGASPGDAAPREELTPERLVWGVPLGHVHQCLHGMAWGPEGDLYFAMGDPHPGEYMDFNRRDHWWHWTFFSRAGEKLAYSGVGGVLRCRPDGSRLEVVAEGTRNSCGLAFDRRWNLFTNDNDHESLPRDFVPGRLLHVTRKAYFSWPRGWMVRKEPDRADLLETLVPDLGRFVPVGQTYYDEAFLGDDYRNNLLVARWGTRSLPRYPLGERGASFAAREAPFLVGREQARPVHVAVGRGGRVFASIAHMAHNEGSPIYRSDLVMITRRDDPESHPFEPYDAAGASAGTLWRELSGVSWWRRYRAHVEILRRGGDLLVEAAERLGRIPISREPDSAGDVDPSTHHLIWLAAASRLPRVDPLLRRLSTAGDAHIRRQSLRALSEFAPGDASREVFLAALGDENAGVRLAALEALLARPGELETGEIVRLAVDPDSYLRQAAMRLLAEQADLRTIVELASSSASAERVVAIIVAGFRLTLAPSVRPLPGRVPLHPLRNQMRVVRYADRTVDLREAARVGVFNIGDWWKQVRDEPESRTLFDVLLQALDDDDDVVRLHAARFLHVMNDERSDAQARELLASRRTLVAPVDDQRPDDPAIPERIRQGIGASAGKSEAEQVSFEFAGVDWAEELRQGDAERGRRLFEELGCSKCHAIGNAETPGLGPSLAEAGKRMTPAYVAESILLPSKAVNPNFRASLVVTSGGETLVGLITSESSDAVELQLPDTTRRSIPAPGGITFRQSLDRSPMPAGLVRSRAELGDLLAFVLAPLASAPTPADDAGSEGDSYFPPPDAAGGWRQATTPGDVRRVAAMDRGRLDEAFEVAAGSTKNGGLVVARNGWLVYERYFGKGHREASPNLGSCGKSVTSIAVGILVARRPDLFPDGLDQKVFTPRYFPPEAFPPSDARRSDIRLGHLLTMTAGIRGNNPVFVLGQQGMIDPIGPDGWQGLVDAIGFGKRDGSDRGRKTTTSTLWCEPGGGYSYATASIHLASVLLRHVSGMELEEYVRVHLAEALGWGRWGYGYRYAKDVTHTPGGGGIALRATDMLRFGYLLLREGRWRDRQLVPVDYVRRCGRRSPYNPHYPYSLQFKVNADGLVPELPRDAFWKSGSGGHVLYVVPSLDLVVWKLGGRDGQYTERDTGLPEHPEATRAARPRSGWNATIDQNTASTMTLRKVIAAMER